MSSEFDMKPVLLLLSWSMDNYEKLSRILTNLRGWFRSEPAEPSDQTAPGDPEQRGILMIGPGGTGKTTLAELLTGKIDLSSSDLTKYNESINVDRYTLEDAPKVELVVTPGQRHRRQAHWPELLSDVAAGAYRGIVVFGSYGYHSLGSSYKNHELYLANKAKSKFLLAYLKEAIEDEIEIVQKLIPFVEVAPNSPWVLSVITKQDLWWKQRLEAEKFYTNGTYGKILDELRARNPHIRYEQAFVSLTISNFRSARPKNSRKTRPVTIRACKLIRSFVWWRLSRIKQWETKQCPER